uniref:F-box associated domain-containing protein n=1 Tax=Aegilops tauschii TaxID=37682 RepID=R7W6D4_AEGTA
MASLTRAIDTEATRCSRASRRLRSGASGASPSAGSASSATPTTAKCPPKSQPLAGFFYNSTNENRFPESALHFVNASGEGRPLIYPLSPSCPATGASVSGTAATACSSADCMTQPVTSRELMCTHYSSESGRWIHKDKGWDNDVRLADPLSPTVFLNGCLHLRTVCDQQRPHIAAVDTKLESWSIFVTPCGMFRGYHDLGLIQQSRGLLHYVSFNNDYDDGCWNQFQVYALEGDTNKEWILKHRFEDLNEFQGVTAWGFDWIATDPECNSVFFVDWSDDQKLSRYDI